MRDLKIKALLFKSLFGIGIFLFIVNIYGSFISLRNDAIYYLNLTDKVTMSPEQFYDSLDYYAKSNLPDTFKLVRMNRLVYKTMLHYWGDELADELNLRIPFYRNYILFTLSYVLPEGYYKDNMRKFEFREYTQAIERGVGLCSQHAIVFTEVARVNGYNVRLLRLNGHVVASVEVDTTKDKR